MTKGIVNKYHRSLNVDAYKQMELGEQLVSIDDGVRYWADSTNHGPEGLGSRITLTLLFPK